MRVWMSSPTGRQAEQVVVRLDGLLNDRRLDGGKSKDSREQACIDHKTSLIGIETRVM